MTATQPSAPGQNAELDNLYSELGKLEEREFDAIECRRFDILRQVRIDQLPIKSAINNMEGVEIYDLTA